MAGSLTGCHWGIAKPFRGNNATTRIHGWGGPYFIGDDDRAELRGSEGTVCARPGAGVGREVATLAILALRRVCRMAKGSMHLSVLGCEVGVGYWNHDEHGWRSGGGWGAWKVRALWW